MLNKKICLNLRFICFISVLVFCSCTKTEKPAFVRTHNGHFVIAENPYYFIGTNFWYGAILGSTGQGGNRERLLKELDFLHENGIDNLRILVGADGIAGQAVKIRPTLQQQPHVYNDTIFEGLDFLLAEMGKRQMYAVLFLNNSWEWSGGYGQYLEWAGEGKVPELGVQDWALFQQQMSKYAECDSCHTLFFNHIKNVLSRTNSITGKKYTEDPAIISWQVGNEPRVFSEGSKPAFVKWLREATALIRSLDKNHLISTGNEGFMGSEMDWDLVEKINADPNVDYMTIHIWAKNWSWIKADSVLQHVDNAIVKTNEYISEHLKIAENLNKPLVIEEFGYPRDNHLFTLSDPTTARDKYYENIFIQINKSKIDGGNLAGCNFWSWGGFGRPAHLNWLPWDDYTGDPAQEEQGLNSVLDTDKTVELIKNYQLKIKN
jgi:mannan endo-1,4-beta-mannosidase